MDKELRNALTIVAALILLILLLYGKYDVDEAKQIENEERTRLSMIASRYSLGVHIQNSDGVLDIDLYPTDDTQILIDKLSLVAEVVPIFEAPRQQINENDWVAVSDILGDQRLEYKAYYRSLNEELQQNSVHPESIKWFIYSSSLYVREDLEQLFNEQGVDYDF
ncbi:hypothetical protein [Amphibacillus cookii]|uniref:hypothetical protein n=1 Tax=Amphibacillus cookii TaxID=767787 RepID=UPI001956D010|nr:hypothetical protein [Amphibacillus cookii]MBM7543038.1 hypothetical protein [Amphibacillus cookii]